MPRYARTFGFIYAALAAAIFLLSAPYASF